MICFEYVVRLVAQLVFENRIAATSDCSKDLSVKVFELQTYQYKLESLILAQNERWRRA